MGQVATLQKYLLMAVARLGLAIVTVLGVATLVFFGMKLIPGTYVDLFFPLSSAEQRAEIEKAYGLDRNIFVQYFLWLKGILQGDFGMSLSARKPVLDEIMRRLPLTLELAGLAALFIVVIGLPFGIISGLFHRNKSSQIGRHFSIFLMSLPEFVLGSFLIFIFSVNSLWLRAGGWVPISESLSQNLAHAILPAFTLAVIGLGLTLGTARSSVMTVMGQDHIGAAVSRGLKPGKIFRQHILRNSLVPVITIFSIVMGYLLGGTVIVEVVYSLDGIGRMMVNAIQQRDYPVVQATVILVASFFVFFNSITDILYAIIDPRIGEL